MNLRWPQGRYNGRRIVGLSIKFQITVDYWRWRPIYHWDIGGLHWLCFQSWTEWVYGKYVGEEVREKR